MEKIKQYGKRLKRRFLALLLFYLREKVIYLTFDDGPTNGTLNCLKCCSKNKVAASFFWVGQNYSRNKNSQIEYLISKEKDKFFICNHSYSHGYNKLKEYYQDVNNVVEDFNRNKDLLGLSNGICRLPGINVWYTGTIKKSSLSLKKCCEHLESEGFVIYGWDIEWEYNRKLTSNLAFDHQKMISTIVKKLRKGYTKRRNHIVILLHDWTFVSESSIVELEKLIIEFLKKGYVFEVLKNYPK